MKQNMKSGKMPVIIAAFIMIFVCSSAYGQGKFFFYSPDRKNAEFDLAARAPKDALHVKPYNDTPYQDVVFYQFDGKDGLDFYCHFLFADMGFGIKRYGVDYKLRLPGGKIVVFGRKYDADECLLASDRFEYRMGPHSVTGDHDSHHLVIDDGPIKLDVTLNTMVPFYRPGKEGKICPSPDCEKSGVFTHFPQFSVTGKLVHDGKTIDISGWGIGNRSFQTFLATEMVGYHSALRWQKDGVGFDVQDYIIPEKFGGDWLPLLMVHKDGKMVHVSQNYKKENLGYYIEPRSGKKIPLGFKVVSESDDVKVEIEYTNVKLTDYNDPLIILTSVEKYIVQLIADAPLDLRFDGDVKLTITTPEGTVTKSGPAHSLALLSQ